MIMEMQRSIRRKRLAIRLAFLLGLSTILSFLRPVNAAGEALVLSSEGSVGNVTVVVNCNSPNAMVQYVLTGYDGMLSLSNQNDAGGIFRGVPITHSFKVVGTGNVTVTAHIVEAYDVVTGESLAMADASVTLSVMTQEFYDEQQRLAEQMRQEQERQAAIEASIAESRRVAAELEQASREAEQRRIQQSIEQSLLDEQEKRRQEQAAIDASKAAAAELERQRIAESRLAVLVAPRTEIAVMRGLEKELLSLYPLPEDFALPEGFSETTVKVNGKEVPAGKNSNGLIVLLLDKNTDYRSLENSDPASADVEYYLFLEDSGYCIPWLVLAGSARSYTILDTDKGPAGYEKTSIVIEGRTVSAWKLIKKEAEKETEEETTPEETEAKESEEATETGEATETAEGTELGESASETGETVEETGETVSETGENDTEPAESKEDKNEDSLYLVYAMAPDGTVGFFRYNSKTNEYFLYVNDISGELPTSTQTEEATEPAGSTEEGKERGGSGESVTETVEEVVEPGKNPVPQSTEKEAGISPSHTQSESDALRKLEQKNLELVRILIGLAILFGLLLILSVAAAYSSGKRRQQRLDEEERRRVKEKEEEREREREREKEKEREMYEKQPVKELHPDLTELTLDTGAIEEIMKNRKLAAEPAPSDGMNMTVKLRVTSLADTEPEKEEIDKVALGAAALPEENTTAETIGAPDSTDDLTSAPEVPRISVRRVITPKNYRISGSINSNFEELVGDTDKDFSHILKDAAPVEFVKKEEKKDKKA